MRIGRREISRDQPPYVIAEIGVNHDGSVDRALELVDAAAAAGADAVKLQLFQTDLLMSKAARLAAYQEGAGETDPFAMLRRLELPLPAMRRVVARAHDRGVHAIVTVFSLALVKAAQELPFDAYKTASPDIINKPLLDALADTGKPMIVSTGTSTLQEIERAIGWLESVDLALLQCVSAYPTPLAAAALGAIESLHAELNRPIGYSDHTQEVITGALAVAAGAVILEKHLTHSRAAPGPDHAASLEPAQLAEYVRLARSAHESMQQKHKSVLDIEHDVRRLSRQSLTTTRAIRRGERLREADLTVKRPGTGIEPFRLRSILGRAAARDLEADMPITEADLA